MTNTLKNRIVHLAGATCAAALLAATAGVAGAQAAPRPATATAHSPTSAPQKACTGYHYDDNHTRIWEPPGCTPP
ncbi:hypothetical protein [Actinacidiphila sp. bgisy160]|uniref:hypothetical protein n=1 Tax=Actinacidiphila sp. bgisy160 TaxID=3413796 RepID=UPI003D739EC2